ncbi:MAG: hypothetical protein K6F93_01870 [Lachnospiraceae bacterium]|nr:hypothetical protein [Lachnospiraceae bacterium]
MAFCKYCGSPIPDGGVCGCPQAQAEAAAKAQAAGAAQPVQGGQPVAQPVQGGQPVAQPAQVQYAQPMQAAPGTQVAPQPVMQRNAAPGFFGQAFAQFATLFKSPFSLITDAASEKIPFASGIVLAGLYALVYWIFNMLFMLVDGYGAMSVLWSFLVMILACGLRFGIAALLALFGKEGGLNFKKALNICFVTTLPASVGWFLFGTLGLIASPISGFFGLVTLLVTFAYYAATVAEYVKSKNKALAFIFIIAAALTIAWQVRSGFNVLALQHAISRFGFGSFF